MIGAVICGAAGRMGRELLFVFMNDGDVKIVGAVESKNSSHLGQDAGLLAGAEPLGVKVTADIESALKGADTVVEFTNPKATLENLRFAAKLGKPTVIGTTGFTQEEMEEVQRRAREIPIVISPNMSQGVNVLFHLVRQAAELLGEGFEVEISEVHHDKKKDSPSGTALQFGRVIADARKKPFEEIAVYGRKGFVGERKKGEMGIHALRIGDVVGEHTIVFGGPGERIEFTHLAGSRKNFANGALRAVKFIQGKQNGLYTMKDVLGIS